MEEHESHCCQALAMLIFDSDGNRWGSYDRVNFFPLPPFNFKPTKLNNQKKHPDDKQKKKIWIKPEIEAKITLAMYG
ncbi:hypothetical protein [Candidatus Nitrososphaera gargensis]|uniref:hypothetical protein n=1 Tax=Candidatus Nitrososphaera gargensis TaxID=497727 RepID=UPI0011E503CF|nr:hypothetical protein [Candidatus Nitrososphaera gargensis]